MEFPEPTPPVRCLQRPDELARLLQIYIELAPRNVLEIGSFAGGTLWYWLQFAPVGARVVSFDLLIGDGQVVEQEKGRAMWSDWPRDDVTLTSHLVSTQSPQFPITLKREFPDGIDFAFIDGGHSYEAVQNDFVIAFERLNYGGVIALHDIFTESKIEDIACAKLWQVIKKSGYAIEEIGKPVGIESGIGCGIGVVYKSG